VDRAPVALTHVPDSVVQCLGYIIVFGVHHTVSFDFFRLLSRVVCRLCRTTLVHSRPACRGCPAYHRCAPLAAGLVACLRVLAERPRRRQLQKLRGLAGPGFMEEVGARRDGGRGRRDWDEPGRGNQKPTEAPLLRPLHDALITDPPTGDGSPGAAVAEPRCQTSCPAHLIPPASSPPTLASTPRVSLLHPLSH
jgi:hypothetical protein